MERHSVFTDKTQRSEKAFRSGALGGSRDEFPEPGQHSLWLENGTDFSERFLAKPLSDLRQSDSFLIGEFASPLDLGPEDFILSGQVFVPQQYFLGDVTSDQREHFDSFHSETPKTAVNRIDTNS